MARKQRNYLAEAYGHLPQGVKKHTNKLIKQRRGAKGKEAVTTKIDRVLWGKKQVKRG